MRGKQVIVARFGVVAAAALALTFAASASANLDASHTVKHAAVVGDCNGNGTPDVQESSWANRDDDVDGFCNGVDACPYEPTATNDSSACQMQAITVPFRPSDPSVPHPTYSGAPVILKGIARYGGTEYMWDYGDGSPPMPWTAISNPYNLGVRHTYSGSIGHLYIATLSVRDSANPSVVATATYPLRIFAGSDLTDKAQTDVRARMAADEALWWLHVNESRGTYADDSRGHAQRYGLWSSGSAGDDCVALDAFETHGSTLAGNYDTDPYVEDTQRVLSLVLWNSDAWPIAQQQLENPDVNGNGLGVAVGSGDDTYTNGVCGIALVDSGAPGRIAPTGQANVYGRKFSDLAQDMVDWFAYAQNDGNAWYTGGWGYTSNANYVNGETFRWPILALSGARAEMGATIPPFVREQLPFYLNYSHLTALDNNNGAWTWENPSPDSYPAVQFTAAGIIAHAFLGDTVNQPDVVRGLGYIYRHWTDPPADGGALFGNLGDADGMWTAMRAFTDLGIERITEVNYSTGQQTANSFDWYYTPAGQSQPGYAGYLIPKQNSDGSWNAIVGSTHSNSTVVTTAQDAMVLMKGAAAQGPMADVGGPYVTDANTPVTLDASHSLGTNLSYTWDLNGDGQYTDARGPTTSMSWSTYTADANGNPIGVTHPVCVRVTDSAGLSDTACTNVTVKPPPHAPTAVAGGPYTAAVGRAITFDASGSFDIDNDPLTYAWDFHNANTFSDATGAKPSYTFSAPGTYVVCVQVTDHPDQNPFPYNAQSETAIACATVDVGVHTPIASAGGPYTSEPNRTITLDASGSSEPDGSPLTYAWDLNGDGIYTDSNSVSPSFNVGNVSPGTAYSVCVKVSNALKSAISCATVTVIHQQQPPVAVILAPVEVDSGPLPVKVMLDGSQSYDINGNPLTFSWTVDDADGTTTNATSAIASHTFRHYGNYTAHLTVSNGYLSSSADKTIQVVDRTAPTLDVPANAVFEASSPAGTAAQVNSWLATAVAADDDPDHPQASLSNDFAANSGLGGVGVGNTVTVTWTATDDVGNTRQKSATVTVRDTTPPDLNLPANMSLPATSTSGAVVTWTATASDIVSGSVPVTCAPASGSTFPAGDTTVSCSAKDGAGNIATGSFVVTVVGDSTPPVIKPTVVGTQGANDWYTDDVHVSWSVTEDISAITDQQGCGASSVTTDTTPAGIDFTCTATSAGGTSTVTVNVKRDATAPTISATRAPGANGAGWSASDVTVTFTCADASSSVASCSPPAVLGEGADQSATGTATDEAGNTATATIDKVNVDKTAPALSGAPTTPSNVNGWYRGDVAIHWTCADTLSGVATCPADSTISGEGTGLTAAAQVSDRAGNHTDATSDPVRIDRTAPVTSVSAPTGWTDLGALVSFTAVDNLSGVAVTYYSVDGAPTTYGDSVTIDTEGSHTITYWSVDDADNVEATRTVTVLVDKSAPKIAANLSPAPNAAGWNNTGVSVGWTCGDTLSGIAFCSPAQLLTGEGKAQPVVGNATDNAGNTAQQTVLVSIDKTDPTISAAADRAPNAHGWYKDDVTVSFTCGDTLSGIALCPAAVTLHQGKAQSAGGTAQDAAGNEASASVSGVNVDETDPTVTYTGNAHTYSVAQTVSITCTAADALSDIDSTTCQNVNAQAWTLGLGTVSLTATATDLAGNIGTGSTSFTVGVTCAGLKTLAGQFSSNAGVTSSLKSKIDAICAAPNKNAKAGKVGAFDNAVHAQRGKALTSAEADELIRLAAAL